MTPDMQRKITTAAHAAGEVASSAMAAIQETFGTGDELLLCQQWVCFSSLSWHVLC